MKVAQYIFFLHFCLLLFILDPENISTIRKLNYSLCSQCNGLSEKLVKLQNLQYVNVRRCRIKDLPLMAELYTTGNLTTLVLDNLKIASTDTLQKLMGNRILFDHVYLFFAIRIIIIKTIKIDI